MLRLELPWLLAAALWIYSLSLFNLSAMQDWGLLSIFPVSLVIAYLLVLFGFAALFLRSQAEDTIFWAYTVLLILMIHGTPQILYGTLRYSWAWKHVGIVDYIIRHGGVDPTIRILNVYHNWPGFFALNALFTQLAGFSGAQFYAGWAPVFFEILFALGVRSIYRFFTADRNLQWLGVWFFVLTNWVGQDYFAPQAIAYFMLFGVLIMVLSGFGPLKPLKFDFIKRWSHLNNPITKLVQPLDDRFAGLKIMNIAVRDDITKFHRLVLGGLILLCFSMIVSSHQLTPNMGIAALFVLVLLGYTRWKMLPIWAGLLILLWLLFPARAYETEVIQDIIDSYGQIANNIDSGLINVATVSSGQALVSWMGRGLTVLIGILAGIGFYRRISHRFLDLLAVSLAAAPILSVFFTSYGGEAVFRIYFFALPYMSFLAAGAFLPDERIRANRLQGVWISGVSLVLLTGMLFAYYGKEQQYYFTQKEVDAAEYLYDNAAPNSLLIEGSRNYPSQFLNYEYFIYVPIDRESDDAKVDFLGNPESVFYRWMSNSDYVASYFIITRSQKVASDTLGSMPFGSLDKIQMTLEQSEQFDVIYSNQDAVIFTIRKGQ